MKYEKLTKKELVNELKQQEKIILRTVELFAGTKSFSKVAKKLGHEIYTVDYDPIFECDEHYDLLKGLSVATKNKIKDADVVWMSPPCTTFSMASGNTHWTKDKTPKTQDAIDGKKLLLLCVDVAHYCIKYNKLFFIENPNGRAVWFVPDEWMKRVWYCQYGDKRAKPTNIWTNLDIQFRTCHKYTHKQIIGEEPKHCHHEPAPRGSKTGTQGLKGAMERGRIPKQLFIEIFKHIENN